MANFGVSVGVEAGLPAGVAPVELQRISLDVYRKMIDHGLILPTDRVELLDGFLVKTMPRNPRHASVTRRIVKLFEARLVEGYLAIKEDPIELAGNPAGDSSPEPDVTIVEGTLEDYEQRHPSPDKIALVVEVAGDARMLARDRAGLSRYAWGGIPSVWIVNLAGRTVEMYSGPTVIAEHAQYAHCAIKGDQDVAETTIGGTVVAIPVADILK